MEDNDTAIESKLSKTCAYLLGAAQIKANSLEQEILMLFNSKYSCNEIKKILKTSTHVIDNLETVFLDIGVKRIYQVVKRFTHSLYNICSHLIQALQKQKGRAAIPLRMEQELLRIVQENHKQQVEEQVSQIAKQQKLKMHRFGGISLYNQNYKRKIDQVKNLECFDSKSKKKKQEQQSEQQLDQKVFKKRLFNKMKIQLKQLEQDIYSPFPDEVSTFLIFQRKFLESFNHLSHAENIQSIVSYLEKSHVDALQLMNKSSDMTEQISKFKVQIENLVKQAKIKHKQRNQNLSDKFDTILEKFIKKRVQIYKKTTQKINNYNRILKQKQMARVDVGVETNLKQLSTLKNIEKRMMELQIRYRSKDEQKQKAFKMLLQKSTSQKNFLQLELTKYKVMQKTLKDDLDQTKKQHMKALQILNQRNIEINNIRIEIRKRHQIHDKRANPNSSQSNEQHKEHKESNQETENEVNEISQFTKKDKKTSIRVSNLLKLGGPGLALDTNSSEKAPDSRQKTIKNQVHENQNQKRFVSIAEIADQQKTNTKFNKNQQGKNENLSIQEQSEYKLTSRMRMRKPFLQQNSLRFVTKNKIVLPSGNFIKSASLLNEQKPQIYNIVCNGKNKKMNQFYAMKTTKTQNNEKQREQNQDYKIVSKESILKKLDQSKRHSVVKFSPKSFQKMMQKRCGDEIKPIQFKNAEDEQYEIKYHLINQDSEKEWTQQENFSRKAQNFEKYKKTQYDSLHISTKNILPILNKSKSGSQKSNPCGYHKNIKFNQSADLQYTRVYSISLNHGDLVAFQQQVDIYQRVHNHSKNNKVDRIKKQGDDCSRRSRQCNNTSYNKQCSNPLTMNREILKQLKFYQQLCHKKSIHRIQEGVETRKETKIPMKQFKSYHIEKDRSLSIQNNNISFQNDGMVGSIIRIKSLMKKINVDCKQSEIIDLQAKKKLIKQMLTEGIKSRCKKQALSFSFKRDNLAQNYKYAKIKYKDGQRLKKTRKKKQEFETLCKKHNESLGQLPQIRIRHIL